VNSIVIIAREKLMFESLRDNHRQKGSKQKPVRLCVEELEERCLLSTGLNLAGGMCTGPDGDIWFTERYAIDRLNPVTGAFQQFTLPSGKTANSIAAGPDGNLWFTGGSIGGLFDVGNSIGRINPTTGVVTEFDLPMSEVSDSQIIAGPDGGMWFGVGQTLTNSWAIDRLDPTTGAIRQFGQGLYAGEFAVGSDGNIWFTEGWSAIGRINPLTGNIQQFQSLLGSQSITTGHDGKIWFSAPMTPFIGTIDPQSGTVHRDAAVYQPGVLGSNGIDSGPDGNLWINGQFGSSDGPKSSLTEVNPSTGQVTEWNLPNSRGIIPRTNSSDIITGPDGKLWFPLLVQENFPGSYVEAIGSFDPSTKTFTELDPTMGTSQTFTLSPIGSLQEAPTGPTVSNDSLSAKGMNISTIAGFDFQAVVANITPRTPITSSMTAYQATVDWGDGTTSSVILTVTDNGTYDVIAGHNYQKSGIYSIKVTIGNYNPANPLGDNPITVFSTANVDDPFSTNM
jgi:streptogramin lyase